MTMWVLFVAIFLVGLFIFFELKDKPLRSLLIKGFASFGFLLVFASALYEKLDMGQHVFVVTSHYLDVIRIAPLILLGLIAGLLGDIHLELRSLLDPSKDKKIIVGGIVFFSVGHIFYLTALLMLGSFSYLSIIIGMIMSVLIFFASKLLKFEMGIAKYPTLFYTFIMFMLVGQALGYAISVEFSVFSVLILSGAILFSISDLLLAPIYYQGNKKKIMIALNFATYYAAQLLIAYSILYII